MDAFTIITGIAGLLGLFLQFKDAFPEHRETRKAIVSLVLGVFVGSLVATLFNSNISFSVPISPFDLLIAAFGSILAFLSIAAAFSSDPYKRSDLFGASGLGLLVFIAILAAGSMFKAAEHTATRQHKISMDEFLELSALHIRQGNYERAIQLLEGAKTLILQSDPRFSTLDKRIGELKAKQVSVSKAK